MVSSRKDLKLLRNPFWPLLHPRLAASATGSARRRSPARACRGQILSNKKETVTKTVTVSFWQGQKDLVSPAGSVGASALRAEVSTGDPHPSTRSACRVFKLFNPNQNKKTPAGVFLFWQGQKDLNPRHAVLETAALPTELYPYICEAPKIGASWWATRDSNPGPFGYEPSALTNWASGPYVSHSRATTAMISKNEPVVNNFFKFFVICRVSFRRRRRTRRNRSRWACPAEVSAWMRAL